MYTIILMKVLSVLGKYLDQPKLVEGFTKSVPVILISGGGIYGAYNVLKSPKEERKKETIKNIAVLSATVASALLAPKIASKIVKGHEHEIEVNAKELVESFIKENKPSDTILPILNKAKEKILSFSDIKKLYEGLKDDNGKKLLTDLIPDPENIDSKHIFSEMGELSILGLVPVLGGITGGILGDKLTEKNWKEKIPDKIKEGSYQYLANIFLCNVGAGVALLAMEQAKIQSKSTRAAGMIAGIILTGVVFGSAIANLIGKICIDPLLHKTDKNHVHKHKDLYSERRPELIDIGLHVDDIATVAVLSGLKWIEPALPILYSISGYRAGIGYRNGEKTKG